MDSLRRNASLGTLGDPYSVGVAINKSGQVAGDSQTSTGAYDVFTWSPLGGMENLGTLGGTFTNATAINKSGQVIGQSQTSLGANHAYLWTP